MRKPLQLQILKVIVDSVEGQVDCVFAFVVHAHADEHLHLEGRLLHPVDYMGFVHLPEFVDEAVLQGEGGEVGSIGTLLIRYFSDIGRLNGRFVLAHGNRSVINFLHVDPGREKHIESGIDHILRRLVRHVVHLVLHAISNKK